MIETIWVFHGAGSQFANGVFLSFSIAESWITKHELSGVLTEYPINAGSYDFAVENGFFEPNGDNQSSSAFIQRFTNAGLSHHHYEDGLSD